LVPGGSVEIGETPEQGALREAQEESGLDGLVLGAFLGEKMNTFIPDVEYHHGHYFHVICPFTPPENWEHGEFDNSTGDPTPIRFIF
ncbi:MAG TPA: NUDIX hydrolase, partial [Aggregatilineales bacterium]|nr:NUDIX hydrolase [Aggregatilineales bacterium]